MNRLLAAAFAFILTPAALLVAEEEELPSEIAAWDQETTRLFHESEKATDLSSIKIPHLVSTKLEKKWGEPMVRVTDDGCYILQYRDPNKPFEIVDIFGFSYPITTLETAPDEMVDTLVNEELTTIDRPQEWQEESVKIKTPEGKQEVDLQFFRKYSGGGADGPRDSTNTFSLTINGQTGYYVVTVESITDATRKWLKALNVE